MSRYALRSTLAALTMAVTAGLVSPSIAAPGGDAPRSAEGRSHRGHHGHHGHHGQMSDSGMTLPGLGPLSQAQLEQLKLDAKQQEQVKTARAAAQELRDNMRDSGAKRHDLLKEQLKAGKLDPHALVEQSNKERAQFRERMDKVQNQWLAVWDNLNDAQRKQVTQIIKERHDKAQSHHDKRHERRSRGN